MTFAEAAVERRVVAKEAVSVVLSAVFLALLSMPIGSLPPIGGLANPGGGIWAAAIDANHPRFAEFAFPELDGTVTVHRDTHGIPHIFATSEHDLFFAQGFVHAQDRLWQMDITRRAARGMLSEILGTDFVEIDSFLRTIGLPSLAREFVEAQDPLDPSFRALAAYAEGVNALIRSDGVAGLPLEFKLLSYAPSEWTPEDTAAIGVLLSWSLSGTFEDLEFTLLMQGLGLAAVDELFPAEGPYQRPVDPRPGTRGGAGIDPDLAVAARDVLARARAVTSFIGGDAFGSNNWAIHGNRTDTGKPRLANDPHLSLQMPSIWYENHLVGAGFDVHGVSFPGAPCVILGQNRRIAWGATNVGADVVDLYGETITGDQYEYRGTLRPMDVRTETIPVKGRAPVTLQVRSTIHGPLISERGQTLAMRWTGQNATGILRTFYYIDRADDWNEFRGALLDFGAPAQNFVYADVDGHIGMRSNGLYPIRTFDARFVADGASGTDEWNGFVPFDEYPESFDPIEDYVLSANQQPQHNLYPYYMGVTWDPGYRARRIVEMLDQDGNVTEDDLKAQQLDTLDVLARELFPFIRDSVGYCGDPCMPTVIPQEFYLLEGWDFRMDEDKAAPAIWWRFANHLRLEIFGDEWADAGVEGMMLPLPNVIEYLLKQNPNSSWFDDVSTPAVEGWIEIAMRAFDLATTELASELGSDPQAWRWGDLHVRALDHLTGLNPLGRGPYRSGGDSLTVNVAPDERVTAGPSWRLVADLSDVTQSDGSYPGGQSGNPLSPHYSDLLELWLDGSYHEFVLPATVADMPAARIESTLILRGP